MQVKTRILKSRGFEKYFNPFKSPNAYNGKSENNKKLPFRLFWNSLKQGTYVKSSK